MVGEHRRATNNWQQWPPRKKAFKQNASMTVPRVQGKRGGKKESASSEMFPRGYRPSYDFVPLPWVYSPSDPWIWPLHKISTLLPSLGRKTSPDTLGTSLASTCADTGQITPSNTFPQSESFALEHSREGFGTPGCSQVLPASEAKFCLFVLSGFHCVS